MDDSLADGLGFLGLSGNDSKVYYALLKLQDATAYEISKKTGIHRSNTYDCLYRLVEKGLASFTVVNNVKRYEVAEPTQIRAVIEEHGEKIEKLIRQAKSRDKVDVHVRIFEGPKGLSQVYRDIIEVGKDYYALGATGNIYELLEGEYEVFVRQRVEKGMKLYAIFDETKKNTKITKFKNITSRYMPPGFISPINTTVYGDKVVMYVWSQQPNSPTVILIESKTTAKAFKAYFDLMWKMATK